MVKVIACRRDRRVDALKWWTLPRRPGESSQGPRLRLDALERCRRSVERASDMVVSSLSRRVLSDVVEWISEASRSQDPEAPLRLAVVRPGFCELNRGSATKRLQRILQEYPLVRFVPRVLKPTRFEIAFRSLEMSSKEEEEHIVFIVDEVEAVETRAFDDLLRALSESPQRCSLVVIAGSAWTPHYFGGGATRLFAREFSLPQFELFVDALLERLLIHDDLGVTPGSDIIHQWLEAVTIAETRSIASLTQRILYFLFIHFEKPGSFLVATDHEALEIVAQEHDVRKALVATKDHLQNYTPNHSLADIECLLYWQQLARALAAMADAALRTTSRRQNLDAWPLLARALFDPDSTEINQDQLRRTVKSALASLNISQVALLLTAWRDAVAQALAPHLSSRLENPTIRHAMQCSRLLIAKLVEFSQIAQVLSSYDHHTEENKIKFRQLRIAVIDFYALGQKLLSQFTKRIPSTAFHLIRFNDCAKAAQPFAGTAVNATVEALASSSKDLRCLAFQVAADHLNVDIHSWYNGFQERLPYADRRFVPRSISHTHDNRLRSIHFVAAIRDLLYTGLVKEPSHKRGRFLVCGT